MPDPESAADPMPPASAKPSLLRRAWLAWTVGGLAAAGLTGALVVDHNAQADRIIAVRAELADAQEDVERLESQVDSLEAQRKQATDRNAELSASLQGCLGGLEDSVAVYNNLIDEINAANAFNDAEAQRFFEKSKRLTRAANRSLEDCRDAAAG